jgi:hypothetical protein
MVPDRLQTAQSYQRAAFKWLDLARKSDSPRQRKRLLAIAEAWLQMAHDAFEIAQNHPTVH